MWYKIIWLTLLSTIIINITIIICEDEKVLINTELATEKDKRLLLFATLDGSLVAIEQETGQIKWRIKDKPIVQVPLDTTDAIVPLYLPDPRDGSLYLLGNSREPLKKLPFTIPQLVASSPCRSSDGILYTGKKKDTWFKLDPLTGNKQQVLGWDTSSPTCPVVTMSHWVYIGRTKYSIMMQDTNKPLRKWNITFYDYTAAAMTKDEITNYEFVHFASSSSGRLVTMDRRKGSLLWDGDLGSPIIAAYLLDSEGLLSVPFTSMANHTISYVVQEYLTHDYAQKNQETPFQNQMKFFPTLYVGEHLYGLYALPSLVDQNVVTISASDAGPLLLGGPNAPELPKPYPEYPIPGHNYRLPSDIYNGDPITFQSIPGFTSNVIFTGHYNVPDYSKARFMLSGSHKQIQLITDASESDNIHLKNKRDSDNDFKKNNGKNSIGIQTVDGDKENERIKKNTSEVGINSSLFLRVKNWINKQENKGLKLTLIILVGCVFAMFWYLQVQVRQIQNISQNGSKSSQQGSTSSRHGQVTALAEELDNGLVKVGKIIFNPEELLGKGCEGTFVYRGEFDSRKVAVKRLLPECFTFADREVALLRESDAHPHVIRYYCMEQDKMFRYIALELCEATLSDYIQGKFDHESIKPLDILKQATAGLAHLHSLDIVHRDIKPHNVLLSTANSRGEVKAMISDFGLCKKLQVGRVSFSRRSGVTGTDGWIAPEMLSGNDRTTFAVDLFSLGCLYYYVLSKGAHPFGDALRRQANILSNVYDLSQLKDEPWKVNLEIPLLSAMISDKASQRPKCNAILKHPIFWDSAKILGFFQDVSDRVEKAEFDDPVLTALEEGADPIVKTDWRVHIHEEVASDLRKYRTYRGDSVRDLLRALRNKKHHFRELTKEAQESLGEIPDGFTHYWVSRFPLLLAHTFITMQQISKETTFQHYYPENHNFSLIKFRDQVNKFTQENPIVLPKDINIDNIMRRKSENSSENFTYLNNKSPKTPRRAQRITFADQSPKNYRYNKKYEDKPDLPNQSGGLYRNLKQQLNIETVDIKDINFTLKENNVGILKDFSAVVKGNLVGSNSTENTITNNSVKENNQSLKVPAQGTENKESSSSGSDGFKKVKNRKKRATKQDEPLVWAIQDK